MASLDRLGCSPPGLGRLPAFNDRSTAPGQRQPRHRAELVRRPAEAEQQRRDDDQGGTPGACMPGALLDAVKGYALGQGRQLGVLLSVGAHLI